METPPEFATAKPGTSSDQHLFPLDEKRNRSKSVTYASDGRRLEDGQPLLPYLPAQLWEELLLRKLMQRLLVVNTKPDRLSHTNRGRSSNDLEAGK